ncbi:E3 ubiquitin ligase BIG BROTHER-related [Diplonema papillatum]|nr:E3 ubiquitin ligase BIG BROTHER-related [Diplonema papillatum]
MTDLSPASRQLEDTILQAAIDESLKENGTQPSSDPLPQDVVGTFEREADRRARLRRESRARLGIPEPSGHRRRRSPEMVHVEEVMQQISREMLDLHFAAPPPPRARRPYRPRHRNGDRVADIDNMSYEELLALEERIGHVPLTITSEQLAALPVVAFKETDAPATCTICQTDLEPGEERRVLPCEDKFHSECIDPWLLNNKATCPCCAVNLREILA